MSCAYRGLIQSLATALRCPQGWVEMCWDAASRSMDASANDESGRGRARRIYGRNASDDESEIWPWLQQRTVRDCSQRLVVPQRVQRMLQLLARGSDHSDPDIASAARLTRRIITSFSSRDSDRIAAIAMMSAREMDSARAVAQALAIMDASGIPIPWRDAFDRSMRMSHVSDQDRSLLAVALWRIGRHEEARSMWRQLSSDASVDLIVSALSLHDSIPFLDALVALPDDVTKRVLVSMDRWAATLRSGLMPSEWRYTHPLWKVRQRAIQRMTMDLIDRRSPTSLMTGERCHAPTLRPLRESLPPALRRYATAHLLSQAESGKTVAPAIDGRDAIAILREQGLDTATIASRMAHLCGLARPPEEWTLFIDHPSAERLRPLLSVAWSAWEWRGHAVMLSCLPDTDREAVMEMIAALPEREPTRQRWMQAALWLWQDRRGESAMPQVWDQDLLSRASVDGRARAWNCPADWLRDNGTFTAAAFQDDRMVRALARDVSVVGRFPRWAEQALRGMSDAQRNHVIDRLIDRGLRQRWSGKAMLARAFRALGWSGSHQQLAAEEAILDGRVPDLPGDVIKMMSTSLAEPMRQALLPRETQEAIWRAIDCALQSEPTFVDDLDPSWHDVLAMAIPPLHIRSQALSFLMATSLTSPKFDAIRRIASIAAHAGWNLSSTERESIRTTLNDMMARNTGIVRLHLIEAVDAVTGAYDARLWNKAMRFKPSTVKPFTAQAIARAALRRWHDMPDSMREQVTAWLRVAVDDWPVMQALLRECEFDAHADRHDACYLETRGGAANKETV